MGDDGHTASLFPDSISLLDDERWVIELLSGLGAGEKQRAYRLLAKLKLALGKSLQTGPEGREEKRP